MSKTRTIVAIFIAALSLSAIGASSASAVDRWWVNGAPLPHGGSAAIASSTTVHSQLLLLDPSETVHIVCSKLLILGGRIFNLDENLAEKLIFHGCSEVSPTNCKVEDLLETNAVLSLAELKPAGRVVILFKPDVGTEFIDIVFSGAGCAIAGEKPVTGSVETLMPNGTNESEAQLLEGLGSVENNGLLLGKHPAFLKGSVLLRLASGLPWDFHP